jgi:hypothetical protein
MLVEHEHVDNVTTDREPVGRELDDDMQHRGRAAGRALRAPAPLPASELGT